MRRLQWEGCELSCRSHCMSSVLCLLCLKLQTLGSETSEPHHGFWVLHRGVAFLCFHCSLPLPLVPCQVVAVGVRTTISFWCSQFRHLNFASCVAWPQADIRTEVSIGAACAPEIPGLCASEHGSCSWVAGKKVNASEAVWRTWDSAQIIPSSSLPLWCAGPTLYTYHQNILRWNQS